MVNHRFFTDAEVEGIGEALIRVLDGVGLLVQNRELLDAARAAGARVDLDAETVTFPAAMTAELLEQVRLTPSPPPSFAAPRAPQVETQIAQLVYDHGTKQRHAGTRADLIEFLKLGEALHRDDGVGHALLLTDVPPLLEPIEAGLLLAEHCTNPMPPFVWNVRQVDYLREMGELLGRENWFAWGATCIAHPFRFDRDVADKYARRVREGGGAGITAMPVAGMTTPLPTAGFVTAAGAEMVASWLLARCLNPTCALGGSIWAGSVDMRTGEVSYCAFDAMRYGFALWEFLLRWTGQDITVGGGEYCDARTPGYFAAWEKAYKAMMIAAFTGRHHAVGQGMLENGKTLCAAQLLLERELTDGVRLLGGHDSAGVDEIGLEDILAIGFGLTRNHFQLDRTLYRFREFGWCPPAMDRAGYRGPETDRAVLDRLQAQVRELVAGWQPPTVGPGVLDRLRGVAERARRELLPSVAAAL